MTLHMSLVHWLGHKLIGLGIRLRPEEERQIWVIVMGNVTQIFHTVKPGETVDVHLTIEMQSPDQPWPNREDIQSVPYE